MNSNRRRVVVTGLGLVTPVGIGLKTCWHALLENISGIGLITQYDASKHSVKIAGEIKNFDPGQYIDAKAATRMDRFAQIACVAASEAVKDSGLDFTKEDTSRC